MLRARLIACLYGYFLVPLMMAGCYACRGYRALIRE
jgi:hypothetical protein